MSSETERLIPSIGGDAHTVNFPPPTGAAIMASCQIDFPPGTTNDQQVAMNLYLQENDSWDNYTSLTSEPDNPGVSCEPSNLSIPPGQQNPFQFLLTVRLSSPAKRHWPDTFMLGITLTHVILSDPPGRTA